MKFIFILTQEINNQSIQYIEEALINQLKEEFEEEVELRIVSIREIVISDKNHTVKIFNTATHMEEVISIDDILLVMKRTWGPDRYQALELCEFFESQGIHVINGCRFIRWSHSKIEQYQQLENKNIFPKSLCYGPEIFEKILTHEFDLNQILEAVDANLTYPIILKTSEGTRASGVCLIGSPNALKNRLLQLIMESKKFIQDMNITKAQELKGGFLIQSYIKTQDEEPNIATYFRMNVVDGKIQSAVRFALKWEETEWGYHKLITQPSCLDQPVNLEEVQLIQDALNDLTYSLEVVGIDIVYCLKEKRYFILEFNDGPVVSEIIKLGKNYCHPPCQNFATEISDLILERVRSQLCNRLVIN